MTERQYTRGAVVKGPDLLGPHSHRPYVCLSTASPPFRDEEAVYTAVTTTRRSEAIPLTDEDFIRSFVISFVTGVHISASEALKTVF
jgi:mRNA interferase MazF